MAEIKKDGRTYKDSRLRAILSINLECITMVGVYSAFKYGMESGVTVGD